MFTMAVHNFSKAFSVADPRKMVIFRKHGLMHYFLKEGLNLGRILQLLVIFKITNKGRETKYSAVLNYGSPVRFTFSILQKLS